MISGYYNSGSRTIVDTLSYSNLNCTSCSSTRDIVGTSQIKFIRSIYCSKIRKFDSILRIWYNPSFISRKRDTVSEKPASGADLQYHPSWNVQPPSLAVFFFDTHIFLRCIQLFNGRIVCSGWHWLAECQHKAIPHSDITVVSRQSELIFNVRTFSSYGSCYDSLNPIPNTCSHSPFPAPVSNFKI